MHKSSRDFIYKLPIIWFDRIFPSCELLNWKHFLFMTNFLISTACCEQTSERTVFLCIENMKKLVNAVESAEHYFWHLHRLFKGSFQLKGVLFMNDNECLLKLQMCLILSVFACLLFYLLFFRYFGFCKPNSLSLESLSVFLTSALLVCVQ